MGLGSGSALGLGSGLGLRLGFEQLAGHLAAEGRVRGGGLLPLVEGLGLGLGLVLGLAEPNPNPNPNQASCRLSKG